MTDFPRGWTLVTAVFGAGGPATITVPATSGVVHVLDSAYWKIFSTAAVATYAPSPTVGALSFPALILPGAVAGENDQISLSGLDIASAPGGTLVISFTIASVANVGQSIVAQGHDI